MSNPKIIITDVDSRKTFDVVNIMQRLYQFECILCGSKDYHFQLPLVYQARVFRLRIDSYDSFENDFSLILRNFKKDELVYLPVSEKPTRFLYQYLHKHIVHNLRYLLPGSKEFDLTSDKAQFQDYCEKNNFPVPRSFNKEDMSSLKGNFRPLVLKPKAGFGSVGILYLNSPEDLEILTKVNWEDYILQEKVHSQDQVTGTFFLCKSGKTLNAYCHQRLRTFPPEGGVTVYSKSIENKEILTIGGALLEKLHWDGLAMIEFMFDEPSGSWKIIELNPRLWGSVMLSAYNNSAMLKDYVDYSMEIPATSKRQLHQNVFIRWYFPFELLGWFKGRLSFKELTTMAFGKTCYVNFTYSTPARSLIYLIYFTFNFSSIRRMIKKIT